MACFIAGKTYVKNYGTKCVVVALLFLHTGGSQGNLRIYYSFMFKRRVKNAGYTSCFYTCAIPQNILLTQHL
jgi:hypothetical protein